jgi:hypothetical protein
MSFDKTVAREKMDHAIELLVEGLHALEDFETYVKTDQPQADDVRQMIRSIGRICEIKVIERVFKNPEP